MRFRRKALVCHPDKVGPDDLEAAEMFHKLSKALEILLGSAESRQQYDATLKAKQMQKLRFQEMDLKRQRDKVDLEEREAVAKRKKGDEQIQDLRRKMEIEMLREQGFRNRQSIERQKQNVALASISIAQSVAEAKSIVDAASEFDCILKVKWKKQSVVTEDMIREAILKIVASAKIIMGKDGKRKASIIFNDFYDTVI